MRKGEQKREKTVAFVKTQAIRQKRLIVENPIVEPVIVCADVAHIHSGGNQPRKATPAIGYIPD